MSRLVCLLFLLAGCASTTSYKLASDVKLASSRYAVSMSSYLVDGQGIVPPSRVRQVGAFEHEIDCAEDGSAADISDAINKQVEAAHGQAIVDFVVDVDASRNCQELRFSGRIVRIASAEGEK